MADPAPMLSIILPASNEAAVIGVCLTSLLASTGPQVAQVIVVANGCHDATAQEARRFSDQFLARGWGLTVLDLEQGGKPGALNAGDAAAKAGSRVYLDADVEVCPDLMAQLEAVLRTDAPRYASGNLVISEPRSWFSRAYARIYRRVPFMSEGVPGAGVFAVNAAGRARWTDFPQIISDDTFVRLQFTGRERHGVPAPYLWPIVEGARNLVHVRARQDRGVAEIKRLYPDLAARDDTRPLGKSGMIRLALSDPLGFAAYAGVALLARRARASQTGWVRGR